MIPADREPVPTGVAVAAIAIVVGIALGLLPLARLSLRWIARPELDGEVDDSRAFAPLDLLIVVAVIVAVQLSLAGFVPPQSILPALAASGVALAAGGIAASERARRAGFRGPAALGLGFRRAPRKMLGAVACYLFAWPAWLVVSGAWIYGLRAMGVEVVPQSIGEEMGKLAHDQRIFAAVLGIVVQPLLEEVLFRGFLQTLFTRYFPAAAAIVSTSIAFAGVHFNLGAFGPIFALSLLLGYVKHTTRSVFASWSVHAAFNAQSFVLMWWFPELARRLDGSAHGGWIG